MRNERYKTHSYSRGEIIENRRLTKNKTGAEVLNLSNISKLAILHVSQLKQAHVAELGCCSGNFAREVFRQSPNTHILAMDLEKKHLDVLPPSLDKYQLASVAIFDSDSRLKNVYYYLLSSLYSFTITSLVCELFDRAAVRRAVIDDSLIKKYELFDFKSVRREIHFIDATDFDMNF